MKRVNQFPSVLKVVGVIVALIGLLPALPGVVQADVVPAPAGILSSRGCHNCALTPGGAVECWGCDMYGQVTGTAHPGMEYHFATYRGPYTQVSAGVSHTCALKLNGDVDCWGAEGSGQDCGQAEDQTGPYIQISAGWNQTCGLEQNGSLHCWGFQPDQPGPYTQVSGGDVHTCAVASGIGVDCWGWDYFGQVSGTPHQDPYNDHFATHPGLYTQVSASNHHTCALMEDGMVDCWGLNDYEQAEDQVGPYIQVSAGNDHSCALRADGAVDCWGNNMHCQVSGCAWPSDPNPYFATHPGPYVQVSAGDIHTCALKVNGEVDCWGYPVAGMSQDQPGPYGPFTPSPTVMRHPQNLTVAIGDTARFSAAGTGWPDPSLQWEVSVDGGAIWTGVDGATTSPLEFTASLSQSGSQYRAVFTNSEGSATSNAAALTVVKRTATVTLSNLSQTYDGQSKAATVTTDPGNLTVSVTYDGSADAPTVAGDYAVVATVVDDTYQGTASGTLAVAPKAASVTPNAASKVYGDPNPALSGTLAGFVDADGVTATYSRTPGEAAAGDYTISAALSPEEALDNYTITYNTAAFIIDPLAVAVTADGKSKEQGEADPELTYTYSPQLIGDDAFSGALTRDPGEEIGTYAIRQGTLALSANYALNFAGAGLIITVPTNREPVAQAGGPYLGAVNTAIQFDGSGSSDEDGDALTYAWTFDDGGTATGATPTHSYTAAGIYDVCLTVNDDHLDSESACTLAVVYDPSAGFVTGGGWITSPAGAYQPDPDLTGKATFGFVSKYQKGAQVPTGNTEFQFDVAGFAFDSDTYEWLVVNQGGQNAQFKGSGLINGAADPNGSPYKFMIWAGDGTGPNDKDTFRIKIWAEATGGETLVYDNGFDQEIGSGNIVVHSK